MQLEFFDVPSPCIGVCQSNDKGQCIGCFRTRDERQAWININNDEKQKIIKRCIQRKNRKAGKVKAKVVEDNLSQTLQPSLLDPPDKSKLAKSDDLDFGDFEL